MFLDRAGMPFSLQKTIVYRAIVTLTLFGATLCAAYPSMLIRSFLPDTATPKAR
jgi:hypothetical protein